MSEDSVVNLSTSAQIAFVKPEGFQPEELQSQLSAREAVRSPIEFFPYMEGRYLAVAASLTGGNALAAFVKMVQAAFSHHVDYNILKVKRLNLKKMISIQHMNMIADCIAAVVCRAWVQCATKSDLDGCPSGRAEGGGRGWAGGGANPARRATHPASAGRRPEYHSLQHQSGTGAPCGLTLQSSINPAMW